MASGVFKSVDTLDFTKYSKKDATETTGEIVAGTVIHQEIKRVYEKMDGIRLQFANYSDRSNKGHINIKVSDNETEVANINLDVSKIKDGEFVAVPFQYKLGKIGSLLSVDVKGIDSQHGSAVTLWMTENKIIESLEPELLINNVAVPKSLHLQLVYFSPKINNNIGIVLLVLLWLMIPTGILGRILNKYRADKKFSKRADGLLYSAFLLVFGFVLLSLRDLSFITSPALYAEDAAYLSNIFEHGFLNTVFMTRGGGTADFQNSGSYILLYAALKTTTFFYGYNLSNLPIFVGVFANLFWSLVAFAGYKTFGVKSRILGFTAFLSIILISMGGAGGEVFGRVLNTVFIWPLLTSFLLLMKYQNRNYSGVKLILIGLLCIVAGLSFPVSYGIVGIYLFFSFARAFKEKRYKYWLRSEWLLLLCLVIGIWLLPMILDSKGITGTMTTNRNSIFEFVVGRHILYPFIQLFYTHLNDKITAVLFLIYAITIAYAGFLSIRKKGWLNNYSFFVCCTVGVVFSSALMRIKMTQLFSEYQTTSPDRYFYGCNAFCILAFLYALYIILTSKKIRHNILASILSLVLIETVANPYLFEYSTPNLSIHGQQDFGTFKDGVIKAVEQNRLNEDRIGFITVTVYPIISEGEWFIYVPVKYAFATMD